MLKAFQKKYNLKETGVLTYVDWQVLKNAYDAILKQIQKEYTQYAKDLYPNYFLSKGMKNDDVRRLQRYLLAICKYDKSIPGVRVNGEFDDLTEKSIMKIQNDYGYDINGVVGPLVWQKLVELSKRE